jgi:hypothetical protein
MKIPEYHLKGKNTILGVLTPWRLRGSTKRLRALVGSEGGSVAQSSRPSTRSATRSARRASPAPLTCPKRRSIVAGIRQSTLELAEAEYNFGWEDRGGFRERGGWWKGARWRRGARRVQMRCKQSTIPVSSRDRRTVKQLADPCGLCAAWSCQVCVAGATLRPIRRQ